jgi:hypothetical protein
MALIFVVSKWLDPNNRSQKNKLRTVRKGTHTSTTKDGTNLINLIKLADYVEPHIRKFVLQQRKKNRKKLFNGSILQKDTDEAGQVSKGDELHSICLKS